MIRPTCITLFCLAASATFATATGLALVACVGDDPVPASTIADAAGSDSLAPADGSSRADADTDASNDAGLDAADAAPEPANQVAAGLTDPYGLAVTSQAVVILTPTNLLRCPQKTCLAPTVLADSLAAPPVTPIPRPYMIDADETAVHFISQSLSSTNKYYYFACPITGCIGGVATRHPYMSEIIGPVGIALGPDGFARFGEKGAVQSCDATTCTLIGGVDVDSTRAFAIDGTTVLYTDTTDPGGTKKATAGVNGSSVILHTTPGHVVAAQADTVYTLTPTKILACAKAGCSGIPTTVVENEVDMTSMLVAPGGVYWTSKGATPTAGSVKTCPLTGCVGAPRVIATGQSGPTSLRLKSGTLYWVNRGTGAAGTGSVMRAGQ